MLFLMRGLPGSGKTTKIQTLTKHIREALGDPRWTPKVFSADDYFMTERGYVHDITKLYLAHGQCYQLSKNCVMRHESPVIIDNTNVNKQDMQQYYDLAYYNWYKFYVIEPDTEWAFNIDTLSKKNVHNVPMHVLVRNTIKYYIPDGYETLEKYEDDSSFYFTGLKRSESGDSQNDSDDRNRNSPRSRTNIQRGSGETDEYLRKEECSKRTPEYRQQYSTEDSRLVQHLRETSPDQKYSSQGEPRSRDPRTNTLRKSLTDEYLRKEECSRKAPEFSKHDRTEDRTLVQHQRKISSDHKYSSQGENRSRDLRTNTQRKSLTDEYLRKEECLRRTSEYRQQYSTEDRTLVQYQRKTSREHKQHSSHEENSSRDPRSKYYDRKSYRDFWKPSRNDQTDKAFNTGHSPENEDKGSHTGHSPENEDKASIIGHFPENKDLKREFNAEAEDKDLWKYDLLGDSDYIDIPLPSNDIQKENESGKDINIQIPVQHETAERLSTFIDKVEKGNVLVDDMSNKCTVVIEEKVKKRMKKQLTYFLKHRQDRPKSVDKDGVDPKSIENNRLHVKESNELETEQDTPQKSQEIGKKPKNIQIKLGNVKSVNEIVSSGTSLTSKHTNEYVVASVTDKIDKPALDEETLNKSSKITNDTSKTDYLKSEAHENECEKLDTETRKDKLSNEKEPENGGPNKGENVDKPESDSEEGELSSEHSDNEDKEDNQVHNNNNNAPKAEKEAEPEEEKEEIEEGEILDDDSDEEEGKSKAGSDDDIEIICEETSPSLPSTTSTKHHPKRDVEKNRLRKQLMAIEEKIKAARRTKRRKRRESSSSSSSSGSSGSRSSSSRSRSSSSSSSSS